MNHGWLLHRVSASGQTGGIGAVVLVELRMYLRALRRLGRLLFAQLTLGPEHRDHPSDAEAARRPAGGVAFHRTARRTESGAARGTTHTGLLLRRWRAEVLLCERNRIDAGILGGPLVALELVALLLLGRLALGGIDLGLRGRRGHGERQAANPCRDLGPIHSSSAPLHLIYRVNRGVSLYQQKSDPPSTLTLAPVI